MPVIVNVTCSVFQSAPPVKGATFGEVVVSEDRAVSIRAPREGGDYQGAFLMCRIRSFNPRPP